MSTKPTPAARRAAEALTTTEANLPLEVQGQAASEAMATAALAAAFDGEEIARELCEQTGPAAYHGTVPCDEHSLAVAVVRDVMLGDNQGIAARRDEIIGDEIVTDKPTVDPRATPLGRAVTALEDRIRRSIGIELRPAQLPGMIGQPFTATMPELARDAVSAALDVEEMAREASKHLAFGYSRHADTYLCACGGDLGYAAADSHRNYAGHIAAALRASILGADQ